MNLEKNQYIQTNGCFTDVLSNENLETLRTIYNKKLDLEFTNSCHTGYLSGYSNNLPFEELVKIKEETLKKNAEEQNIMQYWYFNPSLGFTTEEFSFFTETTNNIIKELYPDDVLSLYKNINHISLTMFDKGCFIINHSDGGSGMALCNILFYVNDDYKDGYGGELVVNDKIIKPEFGRYAVIDFYYSNPSHRVNEILNDTFQRKAFITSIPVIQPNN